jgi:vacuolar-type H+-ATPase subunit F/Vma7
MSASSPGYRRDDPAIGGVVAIGEAARLAGFALAGVDVRAAEDEVSANRELDRLEEHVGLLIITPAAGHALRERLAKREDVVWVTLPG